jgi:hypothetical protein
MTGRKADALRFGVLGVLTFGAVFWMQVSWLAIAAYLMGREQVTYDQQADWIRTLGSAIGWIPWLLGTGLLVFAVCRRRWVPFGAFAAARVFCVAAFLGVIFGSAVVEDYASRRSFDSGEWKAENRRGADGIRVQMVDDLLRRHDLVGMRRAQLEELLGVPPPTDYFSEYDYVYWLGPERGAFSIDSEWLVVKCRQDLVVSAEVVTD